MEVYTLSHYELYTFTNYTMSYNNYYVEHFWGALAVVV